jgi:ABC-type Zn uptake system ZnuABC Zn-binding protein ZnuA
VKIAPLRARRPGASHFRGASIYQAEDAEDQERTGALVHGFGNPHYWLDPANARPMTRTSSTRSRGSHPTVVNRSRLNRTRFLERLDAGLARWTAALAPYRGARAVAYHDSWPYFARRFGLVIVATVEPVPGVPPSAASLPRWPPA